MPNSIIRHVKQLYPQYRDIPDDELTLRYARQVPSYLKNAEFKSDYDRLTAPNTPVAAPKPEAGVFESLGRGLLGGHQALGGSLWKGTEYLSRLAGIDSLAQEAKENYEQARSYNEMQRNKSAKTGLAGFARMVGEAAPSLLPVIATAGAGLPAAVAASGLTGGLSTLGTAEDAYKARYLREGMSEEEASSKARTSALLPATLSGITTAVVTRAFGATGVEAISGLRSTATAAATAEARQLALTEARQILTQRFVPAVATGAVRESAEEFVDQLGQSVIERMSYNPELTLAQAIENSVMAGAVGGVLGGGVTAAMRPHTVSQAEGVVRYDVADKAASAIIEEQRQEQIRAKLRRESEESGAIPEDVEAFWREESQARGDEEAEERRAIKQQRQEANAQTANEQAASERGELTPAQLEEIRVDLSRQSRTQQQVVADNEATGQATKGRAVDSGAVEAAGKRLAMAAGVPPKPKPLLEAAFGITEQTQPERLVDTQGNPLEDSPFEASVKMFTALFLARAATTDPATLEQIDAKLSRLPKRVANEILRRISPQVETEYGGPRPKPDKGVLPKPEAEFPVSKDIVQASPAPQIRVDVPQLLTQQEETGFRTNAPGVEVLPEANRPVTTKLTSRGTWAGTQAEAPLEPVAQEKAPVQPLSKGKKLFANERAELAHLQDLINRGKAIDADLATKYYHHVKIPKGYGRIRHAPPEATTTVPATTPADITPEEAARIKHGAIRYSLNAIMKALGVTKMPPNIKVIWDENGEFAGQFNKDTGEIIINVAKTSDPEATLMEEGLHAVWDDKEIQKAWNDIKATVTEGDMAEQSARHSVMGTENVDIIAEEAAIAKVVNSKDGLVARLMNAIRRALRKVFGVHVPLRTMGEVRKAAIKRLVAGVQSSGQSAVTDTESGNSRFSPPDSSQVDSGSTVTPDSLPTGEEANSIQWYHGGGWVDRPSSTFSRIEGLLGSGFYVTDSPEFAESYAQKRKRGVVNPIKVSLRKAINMEKPLPPDAAQAFLKAMHGEFEAGVEADIARGKSGMTVFRNFAEAVSEDSVENWTPLSEYVEMFQAIEYSLIEAGYDAYTHIGGLRAGRGKALHKVLVVLDPSNEYANIGSVRPPAAVVGELVSSLRHAPPESRQAPSREQSVVDYVNKLGGLMDEMAGNVEGEAKALQAWSRIRRIGGGLVLGEGNIDPPDDGYHAEAMKQDLDVILRSLMSGVNAGTLDKSVLSKYGELFPSLNMRSANEARLDALPSSGAIRFSPPNMGVSAAAANMEMKRSGELADDSFWKMWQTTLRRVGFTGRASGKNLVNNAEIAARDVAGWLKSNPQYLNYYHTDWKVTLKVLIEEFPQMSGDQFFAFRIMTGLTSPSTALPDNMVDSVKLLGHLINGGRLHDLKLRVSGKGNRAAGLGNPITLASTTGATKIASLHAVEVMHDKLGSWKAVAGWLAEPVPYRELHAIKKSLGYKGGVGKIGGSRKVVMEATGQDELVPRAFIFGQKVGSYTLNSLGHDKFTTTDIWEGRFIRSHFPHMFNSGTGLPENVTEQSIFQEFSTRFNENIQRILKKKLPPSALQAARWFFMIQHAAKAGYAYAKTTETISEYVRRAIVKRRSGLNDGAGNNDGGGTGDESSQSGSIEQPNRARERKSGVRHAPPSGSVTPPNVRNSPPFNGALGGTVNGVGILSWADKLKTEVWANYHPLTVLQQQLARTIGGYTIVTRLASAFENLAGVAGIAKKNSIEFRLEIDPLIAGIEGDFNQYLFWQYAAQRTRHIEVANVEVARLKALLANPSLSKADRRSIRLDIEEQEKIAKKYRFGNHTYQNSMRKLGLIRTKLTNEGNIGRADAAVTAYGNHTTKALTAQLNSGYISQAMFDSYKKQNPIFYPMIQTGLAEGSTDYSISRGIVGIDNPDFKVEKPLDAADIYIYRSYAKAESNKAKLYLYHLARLANNPAVARIIPVGGKAKYSTEAAITLRLNGQDVSVVCHPAVVDCVALSTRASFGVLEDLMAKGSSLLRFGATTASAAFQIKNFLLSDFPTLALMSKAGVTNPANAIDFVFKVVTSFSHAFRANILQNYSPEYLAFMESGAMGTSLHSAIDRMSGRGGQPTRSVGLVDHLVDYLGAISQTIEQTPKIAGFRILLKRAGVNALSQLSPAEQVALVSEVRNYCGSPDFARVGSAVKQMRAELLFVFLRAGIAGQSSALERLTGNLSDMSTQGERSASAVAQVRAGFLVGLAAYAAYALNHMTDELREDYERVPDVAKGDAFYIPTDEFDTTASGEKVRRYIVIPKRGFVKVIANPIEAYMGYTKSKSPAAFSEMLVKIGEELMPLDIKGKNAEERIMGAASSVNPIVRVPVEYATGFTFYSRSRTVPRRLESASVDRQYTERTNENVKSIATLIGVSPLKLEQVMTSMTGGISRSAFPRKDVEGNEGSPASVPLVRNFISPPYREPVDGEMIDRLFQEAADASTDRKRLATQFVKSRAGMDEGTIYTQAKEQLGVKNRDVVEKVRELLLAQRSGVTEAESRIIQLPPKQRAQLIMHQLARTSPQDRARRIQSLVRTRVLTRETAYFMRAAGFQFEGQ